MNERHPYEKHLADKLQQLPPPGDVNQNWEKMRKLLDEEMPRGGGFGGNGRNRWWITGIIIGILILGTWMAGSQLLPTGKQAAPTVAANPNTANVEETNPSGESSPSGKQPSNAANASEKKEPTTREQVSIEPAADNTALDKKENKTGSAEQKAIVTAANNNDVVEDGNNINNKPVSTGNKQTDLVKNNSTISKNSNTKNSKDKEIIVDKKNSNRENGTRTITGNTSNKTGKKENPSQQLTRNDQNFTSGTKNRESVLQPSLINGPVDNGGSLISPSNSITEAYTAFTETELDPDLVNKQNSSVAKSKSARSGKSREDRTFAIGISLPLGFPLGDQKPLAYNRNAGVNTISDYIPAPNFQYHFNNKTYIQTEVQIGAPQFIRPILLYQQKTDIPSSNYAIYNSVYAKKLYYFNIPVAIHHSPFKNFYMGTGLQFSTMISGLALYEETKRGPNTQEVLLSEKYTRFGNDSLSRRFNGSEMRVLLDMNYYFDRFTVGLRYNQAVNNYVNFRLNNTTGYTYDKNKALQFYLRYNLWEDIKRKKPAKSFLSFK